MIPNSEFQEAYDYYSVEQKETLQTWIHQNLQSINSINGKCGSYGLKHDFEGSENGFYLPDAAFIVAMIEAGFYVDKENSLNCSFNISQKSVKHLRN